MSGDGTADRNDAPADAGERSVVERARAGDRSGFGELVDRYGEELMRTLVCVVGSREASEDVFQETWVRVIRGIRRFDPGRPFAPWLFRIARNLAYDHLRRRRRWKLFGLDRGEPEVRIEQAPPAPDPADRIAARDLSGKLLGRLDPLYREVIALRFFDDRSYREIADHLGVPLGTAQSRIHRALDRLAELYEEMVKEPRDV
ncbi:MAG: sigma-70 family RNA polymerase sigma factor [Candidatus Eisenbacteria bacterium]